MCPFRKNGGKWGEHCAFFCFLQENGETLLAYRLGGGFTNGLVKGGEMGGNSKKWGEMVGNGGE